MRSVEISRIERPPETDADTLLTARVTDDGVFVAHAEARDAGGRWHLVAPWGDLSDEEILAALRPLVEAARHERVAPIDWWVRPADDRSDRLAAALGLTLTRELHQMRRSLPVEGPPVDLATRPFRVGTDEATWLEVNNAAFAWHEEQADWTIDDLRERFAEPWFDPDGLLLHERDGRLAGFCWTKVHEEPERLGEIFVIAVHPDFHGHGLGRALTQAGLGHLAGRGLDVGMLWVEASNAPAIALYRDLGFTRHESSRRYTRAR